MIRSALMNVMTAAVIKAGKALKRDFGEVENLQVSIKGPGDFVSAADRRAEKTLFEELSKVRPGYGFIMEESGIVEGSDPSHRWIIDPLDGTTNFLHGIPHFAISVGLEREGVLVAGIVYNPATEDMYIAEKGQGAFHNNRRLRVSARREMSEAMVGGGAPHLGKAKDHPLYKHELANMIARAAAVRSYGATALDLAYVAAGRFDALWQRGCHIWDVAAGAVLVREAGGYVSDADRDELSLDATDVAAGNEYLHRQILDLLKQK